MTLTYLKVTYGSTSSYRNLLSNKTPSIQDVSVSSIMLMYVLALPVIATVLLWRLKERLRDQKTRDKFGYLYPDLRVWNGRMSYYLLFFMLRRLLLVMLPLVLINYPVL